VVSPASTEALPDGTAEHFGVNCRTVDIGSPTEVVADDELGAEDPSEPEDSMEEPTHGALVSAFAKDVKAADAAGVLEELAADGTEEVNRVNRGSFISRLAKLNPFKKDKDDTGSETEVDEADHDPEVDAGKAEKAPKVDNPNKANGKSGD
jgi:hypothetical protein